MSKASVVHQKIAKNINRFRKEKGMSQEKLAAEAGLNRAYIGYIERGERKPSVETLDKITKSLNIELQQLFNFKE